MRKTIVGGTAVAVAVGIGGVAAAGGFQFRTTATSGEEVPPPGVVVMSDAEAKLNLKLDRDGESADYNLRITHPIQDVFMAHLHRGAPGTNGPIAVWLYPEAPPGSLIEGTHQGRLIKDTFGPADLCYSPTAPYCVAGDGDWDAFVSDLEAGLIYLNVHTLEYPAGEVRGQVHPNAHHG